MGSSLSKYTLKKYFLSKSYFKLNVSDHLEFKEQALMYIYG